MPLQRLAILISVLLFATQVRADEPVLRIHPEAALTRIRPAGGLALDPGGGRVRFSLVGGPQVLFSVTEHLLKEAPVPDPALRGPVTAAPGLRVETSAEPARFSINGAELPLLPGESVRCLALHPETNTAFAATSRYLRAFAAGEEAPGPLWQVPLPAEPLALNASADGRVLVAALADGTLRWFAARDGQELLALLVRADRLRWVAWTPSGFYDAPSPDTEFLVWQVRDGEGRPPDLFRPALFREHYYRPDLTGRVLATLDERSAVAESDAARGRLATPPVRRLLPPVVRIDTPRDGTAIRTGMVQLQISVRSPSGEPVMGVRTLVHGRQVQQRGLETVAPAAGPEPRGLLAAVPASRQEVEESARLSRHLTLRVSVPAEDCTVAVIAETALGRSEPVQVRLRWLGGRPTPQQQRPALYVLAVGVGRYPRPELRLRYPVQDARDLAAAFQAQQGLRYRQVETRLLLDGEATRARVLTELSWLTERTTAEDVAVVFLAGHGVNDPRDGKYYYLAQDADPEQPAGTAVDSGEIQAALSAVRGKVLLFLDTCHAGQVMGPRPARSRDVSRLLYELSSAENGIVVYTATSGSQAALESGRWRNGAFTRAVVEGLRGKAAYGRDGRVTVSTMEHYIGERVRTLTSDLQTPTTAKPSTVPDFWLATVPPPLHRRPWLWTVVGLGVATVAAVVVLAARPWEVPLQRARFEF